MTITKKASRCALLVAGVVGAAAPAHANKPTVWQRLAPDPAELLQQKYRTLIQTGDDQLLVAMGSAHNTLVAWENIKTGLGLYRTAIALAPDSAEAYYHLGSALTSILSDCRPESVNPASKNWCRWAFSFDKTMAREAVNAELTFLRLAPLDPRSEQCLESTSTMLTRITGTKELRQAIEVYREIIDRQDPDHASQVTLPNLAEIYMMLGDLQPAIAAYSQAVVGGADASAILGLAVALDRSGQGQHARQLLRAISTESLERWQTQLDRGDVYYVPSGEIHYYLGLLNDAQGNNLIAAQEYEQFIASGAHPQFAARAKQNRANLRAAARAPLRPRVRINEP